MLEWAELCPGRRGLVLQSLVSAAQEPVTLAFFHQSFYCAGFAKYMHEYSMRPLTVTEINPISYLIYIVYILRNPEGFSL